MAENLPQGHRRPSRKRVERQHVSRERRIQIQPPGLDLLHDSDGIEELGDAADPEYRITFGLAETSGIDQTLIVHERNGDAPDVPVTHFPANVLVERRKHCGVVRCRVRSRGSQERAQGERRTFHSQLQLVPPK
jgi:hypothetical protein